jgi:hypothetical protein
MRPRAKVPIEEELLVLAHRIVKDRGRNPLDLFHFDKLLREHCRINGIPTDRVDDKKAKYFCLVMSDLDSSQEAERLYIETKFPTAAEMAKSYFG